MYRTGASLSTVCTGPVVTCSPTLTTTTENWCGCPGRPGRSSPARPGTTPV
ncbi:hypothetical protein E2C01_085865 [Portunus trituberculatus]|uniref:Uncharacterized protein n=1 Tax=Portunus trituberculatus TaxID=210409 RepID=A0A5B7J3V3_PORTR|nr:hypothetical protein [Portunus trituberculatus]